MDNIKDGTAVPDFLRNPYLTEATYVWHNGVPHVDLPIDPTRTDASPQELLRDLPSRVGRRRVLQAAELSIDVDGRGFAETLDELSQIEIRRVASQLRFAGARTVHYYRVDGLQQVTLDGATGRVDDISSSGAYGPEIQTAVRDHDRIYVVCDVPDTGTQTQLTVSDADRTTTVATFEPHTSVLAVRAPDDDTADATVRAVMDYLEIDDASRISFLDGGFRGRFEDACVAGYSTLRLQTAGDRHEASRIEVRPEESGGDSLNDVRVDPVVSDILEREDIRLDEAEGLVTVAGEIDLPDSDSRFRPRVTIGFSGGRVRFEQFVPEQILLKFDDVVRDSL